MNAIMTRSFAKTWGLNFPPDAAYLIKSGGSSSSWQSVTWNQVMEDRRERQAWRLARKRESSTLRAIRVSVRYFKTIVYGGWHTYIDGVGFSKWVRSDDKRLMELFPMPAPSLFGNAWQEWMKWFARTYRRGTFNGKPRGVAYCWALCYGEGRDTYVEEVISIINRKEFLNGR